jgi:hypothetical protein
MAELQIVYALALSGIGSDKEAANLVDENTVQFQDYNLAAHGGISIVARILSDVQCCPANKVPCHNRCRAKGWMIRCLVNKGLAV